MGAVIKKQSFADKIMGFHLGLDFTDPLPPGFAVLNPIKDNPAVPAIMRQFYDKYYADRGPRKFIIGINPGRHGAGTTGIPFTDSKRLQELCGIKTELPATHEVSAHFVYDMIAAYGGPKAFYKELYIQSMFPLALVRDNGKGGQVNCNYYDDPRLLEALEPYMLRQLKMQVAFGVDQQLGYVLGKKNFKYVDKINKKEKLFERLLVLDHPRYIQQYRSKDRAHFIDQYIEAFKTGHLAR